MDNYIIRVYRCEKDNPRLFVGMVEAVEQGGRQAFTNMQELWEILNARAPQKKESDRKQTGEDRK